MAAVRNHRFIEPRLTPFYEYSPCIAAKSSGDLPSILCSPIPDKTLRPLLVQITGQIQKESRSVPLAVTLHAQGILSLIRGKNGDPQKAVAAFKNAQSRDPSNPRILNDLAVAYELRAHDEGRPWDMILALSTLEQALRLDPKLLPARFNRALLLQKLSMHHQASRAWRQYLGADGDSSWAIEARIWERNLMASFHDVKQGTKDALGGAALRSPGEANRLVEQNPQEARRLVEEVLLGAWARHLQEGNPGKAEINLTMARMLGDSLARIARDEMVQDSVEAIDRAARLASRDSRIKDLAAGHQLYSDALALIANRRFHEAEPLLQKALRHMDKKSPFALWVRFGLMRCAFQDWRHKEALTIGSTILETASHRRYPSVEGRTQWVRATTLISLGRSEEAIRAYQEALHRFESTGEIGNQAQVLALLASSLDYAGVPLEAWEHRYRALQLYAAGQENNRQLRVLLTAAAGSALENGQADAALVMLDEVVDLATETPDPLPLATALLHRARIRRATGTAVKARKDLVRARELCKRIPQEKDRESLNGEILFEEGRLLRDSDPRTATKLLTDAEKVFINNSYPLHLPRLYYERARAHLLLDEMNATEMDLGQAIDILEDQRSNTGENTRRISFLDRMNDILEEMIVFQVDHRQRPDLALDASEKARARVLLDWLSRLPAKGYHRPLQERAAQPQPYQEIKALLPDSIVFVQYEVIRDRLLLWIVSGGKLHLEQVSISSAALEQKVRHLHQLRSRHERGLTPALADLFDLLVRPVQSHLLPGTQLVISPDETLHQVPFAALVDRRSGHFLIQDVQISQTPSLNTYLGEPACTDRLDLSSAHLLVVAAPSFDRALYPSLPLLQGAEEEGRTISKIYPKARSLVHSEATRTRVIHELAQAEVFHFSGHALTNPRSPMLSSLVLAAPDYLGDSSSLPAQDILAQPLPHLRLVVLSSCRSAGSSSSETEGLLGLAWPFLARGVPSVIASLWDVDDASAAWLFAAFYQNLRRGLSPPEALREAQLAAITQKAQSSDQPIDWAAFQVFWAGQARCQLSTLPLGSTQP